MNFLLEANKLLSECTQFEEEKIRLVIEMLENHLRLIEVERDIRDAILTLRSKHGIT